MRAALQWALEGGDAASGMRLAAALWQFWERRGLFSEGRGWLERLLEAGQAAPAAARAPALLHAGQAAAIQGDHTHASELIEASIQLYQQIGDTQGVAEAMTSLGIARRDLGDYPRATVLLEVALELHRSMGNRQGIALATNMLGCIARNQGDYPRAEKLLEESLALFQELRNTQGIATLYHDLGESAQLQGDDARAAELYAHSNALFRDIDIKVMIAWSLHNQGYLRQRQGDTTQALAHFRESLQLFQKLGTKDGIAACFAGIARVAVATGDARRAARLLGASEAVCESIGGLFVPVYAAEYDRTVAMGRDQLHAGAWETAFTEGRTLTIEQAIAYALDQAA